MTTADTKANLSPVLDRLLNGVPPPKRKKNQVEPKVYVNKIIKREKKEKKKEKRKKEKKEKKKKVGLDFNRPHVSR